jgi:hypothetical protein
MSSSVRPACANSSNGRYILPLLELRFPFKKTKTLGYKFKIEEKKKKNSGQ